MVFKSVKNELNTLDAVLAKSAAKLCLLLHVFLLDVLLFPTLRIFAIRGKTRSEGFPFAILFVIRAEVYDHVVHGGNSIK